MENHGKLFRLAEEAHEVARATRGVRSRQATSTTPTDQEW